MRPFQRVFFGLDVETMTHGTNSSSKTPGAPKIKNHILINMTSGSFFSRIRIQRHRDFRLLETYNSGLSWSPTIVIDLISTATMYSNKQMGPKLSLQLWEFTNKHSSFLWSAYPKVHPTILHNQIEKIRERGKVFLPTAFTKSNLTMNTFNRYCSQISHLQSN